MRQLTPPRSSGLVPVAVTTLALTVLASITLGQEAATLPAEAIQAAPQAPTQADIDTGSTAWMLTSSALVLLMVPGLALFYGGMVRAKNVLNTFLLCMVAIGVIGLQWVIAGYSLAFGTPLIKTDGGWSLLGWSPGYFMLRQFSDYSTILTSGDTDPTQAVFTRIPGLAFVMFQGKFAIITPALIVGAVVERVKFGPFVLFMVVWSFLIYDPVAHWVWNVNGWLYQWGVLDFAGGTVVHVLGGVSALALCYVVGPRKFYGELAMPPHSLGLTLIGAGMLWFGWFGFNAGSAVAISGSDLARSGGVSGTIAALAFANTQIAAAAAATAWLVVEWLYAGKPTILGFASGMVAGLVVITPCAGHVAPMSSIWIGLIGGAFCFFCCKIKNAIKADDSLDAFGVHGMGGALGAILVGVFVIRPEGLDSGSQVVKQLVGISVAAVFAFVGTLVIAKIIDALFGLRASENDEEEGLDITAHGEQGYHLGLTSGTLIAGEHDGLPDARGTGVHR